jgi:hypothetical protein
LLVAPGFEGSANENSSIETYCTNNEITPVTIEDLARLVDAFPFRSVTPETFRDLLILRTPTATKEYVDKVIAADAPSRRP